MENNYILPEVQIKNLSRIERFFTRKNNQGYIFGIVNNESNKKVFNQILHERTSGKCNVSELNLLIETNATLIEQLENTKGNALIINNLTEWLKNKSDNSNYSALNFIREAILKLNKPILFWVNDIILPDIINFAHDFFSQRRLSNLNFLTKNDLTEQRIFYSETNREFSQKINTRITLLKNQLAKAEKNNFSKEVIATNFVFPLILELKKQNSKDNWKRISQLVKIYSAYLPETEDINEIHNLMNNKSLEGMDEDETTSTHKMRTNHLLIIAIDEYENGIQDLNNAVRDAEAVKEVLWKTYQFSPENTKVLTNKDATRYNIISAFENFVEELTPDDNFVFYFSGHGDMYKPTLRGYWIPADGKPRNRSSWLSNNDIKDFMEHTKAHHVFGIVDSCFSGALFRKNAQENENTLMYLDSYPSRWLLTAGRETIVPDGVPGTHSPFAKTLISQLSYNPDNALAVSKLCSDVIMSPAIDKVNAKPRGSALPLSSSQGGEFIFYKKGYTPKASTNTTTSGASKNVTAPKEEKAIPPATNPNPPTDITNANISEHLKKLVRLGDTEKAFELLNNKINSESRIANDLTLVQARYNRLVREKRNGLITDEYFSMSNARITHSLLSTIDRIDEEDLM